MYKIVLIDDDRKEFAKIRRTIKENEPDRYSFINNDYKFEEYNLNFFKSQGEIVDNLIDLIKNKDVSLIIVDYKLITNNNFFEGNRIFADVCKAVSKFPIIILTEKLNESLEGFLVDADKVYEKSEFFDLESAYAKEKVSNLFYNMESYNRNLCELEENLMLLMGEMQNNQITSEIINKINALETELAKYIPLDHCQAEELYNPQDLKEVVSLLSEVNKLIRG